MSYFAHPETKWGYPSKDGRIPYVPTPRAKRIINMLSRLVPHANEMGLFDAGMVRALSICNAEDLDGMPDSRIHRIGHLFIKHCWDDK